MVHKSSERAGQKTKKISIEPTYRLSKPVELRISCFSRCIKTKIRNILISQCSCGGTMTVMNFVQYRDYNVSLYGTQWSVDNMRELLVTQALKFVVKMVIFRDEGLIWWPISVTFARRQRQHTNVPTGVLSYCLHVASENMPNVALSRCRLIPIRRTTTQHLASFRQRYDDKKKRRLYAQK